MADCSADNLGENWVAMSVAWKAAHLAAMKVELTVVSWAADSVHLMVATMVVTMVER